MKVKVNVSVKKGDKGRTKKRKETKEGGELSSGNSHVTISLVFQERFSKLLHDAGSKHFTGQSLLLGS